MLKQVNRNITDFLEDEYKSYVFYVLENRALPNLMDGFKTGARKIMHAAFNGGLKNGETKKLLNLSGDTMNLSLYPHGDASLNGTIITLSQDFKFNLNPLFIDGQYGVLRAPKAISAPRYLYVKLSEWAKLYKTDYELLNFVFDEGQYVEPEYYMPIIPMVLVNRQEGMAPGYKFSNMSYNPADVTDACITYLTSRKRTDKLSDIILHPYIKGIKPENWVFEEGKWVNYGKFKTNISKDLVEITDLPYGTSFEDFEKLLNKMIDAEQIKDWKNLSEGDSIHYQIHFLKKRLGAEMKGKNGDKKIIAKFKLRQVVPDDLLWVLDETDKIRHFKTPKDLIAYFTEIRLSKYDDRKKRLVKILEERYKVNSELVKFIELVCKGKLKIRNRIKADIKADMDIYKLPMSLIGTPMSKCTIEERDELLKENEEIRKNLEYIKKTTTKEMYLQDLKELKKELDKKFK